MGNQFGRKGIKWIENKNGCQICVSHCKDKTGYIRYRVNGKLERLHKVIYERKYGPVPEGYVVMHQCDNPSCINIEHLTIGTQRDNMQDCISKNRKHDLSGESNGRSKLTKEQVINILNDNRKQVVIAKEYGVTQAQISSIKLKRSWNKAICI